MTTSDYRPRLLDLCCGVGGASVGYIRAGFDVVGVDLKDQPHYGGQTFVQADALEYLEEHGHEFDVVHASFPCQGYSIATPTSAREAKAADWYRTDLIPLARELSDEFSLPLIMENVPRAERDYRHPVAVVNSYGFVPGEDFLLLPVQRPITLCGQQFGLPIIRHRVFEVGEMVSPLEHVAHQGSVRGGQIVTVAGHGADNAYGNNRLSVWRDAMGMQWAGNRHELAEAIPPAFTEYLGRQVIAWL